MRRSSLLALLAFPGALAAQQPRTIGPAARPFVSVDAPVVALTHVRLVDGTGAPARDDQTVVAGILHDVIEDCVREAYTRQMLEQRIGDKFGGDVLDTVLAVTQRRLDDDGVELSYDERRDDYLERLSMAGDAARWVCAADALHNAATLLADLRRTIDPDTVWRRFTANREDTARWYRRILDRLRSVGFQGDILRELEHVVVALEAWARDEGTREETSNRYTGAAEA